jgi:hypothetical protein
MSGNAAVNQPELFERIATDVAYLAQFLRELRKITEAAREVTWQRYHADPNDTFGKEFPTVSLAIFQLANLVGIPSTSQHASASQQKHEANQY